MASIGATPSSEPTGAQVQEVPPVDPMVEIGRTGIKHTAGFMQEEFLKDLRGQRGMRKYGEMRTDSTVGAVMHAVSMLMRQVSWSTQAADNSGPADEAAQFVDGVFDDMSASHADTISDILNMLTYGYTPLEIVYKFRRGPDEEDSAERSQFTDGKIGIRKLAYRSPESVYRWIFDPAGGINGFEQVLTGTGDYSIAGNKVVIPIQRALLFRTDPAGGNPEGRSILRPVYKDWFYKNKIEELRAIGIERDLAGYPVMRVPSSIMQREATPDQKATLASYVAMIGQIRRDTREGTVLPSDRYKGGEGELMYDLQLIASAGSRQVDTSSAIKEYSLNIAMAALAQFLFLGTGSKGIGSFALSSDQTGIFAQSLEGFLDMIAGVFNRHLIPRLWKLNGMDPAVMPKRVPAQVRRKDLGELGTYLAQLAAAGMMLFPNRDLENELLDSAGLPLVPDDGSGDEDMLARAQAAAIAAGAQAAQPGAPGQLPQPGGAAANLNIPPMPGGLRADPTRKIFA